MIRANFNMADIRRKLLEFQKKVAEDTVKVLQIVGEMAVNEAKESGAYKDQTSNLRSSIGYVIVVNGQVINESFERSGSGKIQVFYSTIKTRKLKSKMIDGGVDGVSVGQAFARSLAGKYKTGFALIVVAGMNYAAYVEAHGLNVLSTAESIAKAKLPVLLQQIKKNRFKL